MTDVSAVGLRAVSRAAPETKAAFEAELCFENGRSARVKLAVVWTKAQAPAETEMGLEVVEAGRDFYDALPLILPRDT